MTDEVTTSEMTSPAAAPEYGLPERALPNPPAQGGQVSFAEAAKFWLRLGFISFGGPAGQIAIMHREIVERRGWLSEERFLHALNYCMLLPGPEAQQLATYVGWLLHRVPGGLVAGGLFVLPSVFVLLALSWSYAAHGDAPLVAGALYGFRPVVVAIVCEAVIRIARRAIRTPSHIAIASGAFAAIYVLGVPFPLIVAAAAAAGWASSHLTRPHVKSPDPSGSDRDHGLAVGPAVHTMDGAPRASDNASAAIVDRLHGVVGAEPPPHTIPSMSRFLRTLSVGALLWLGGLALVVSVRGFDSLHAQLYRFFTKAAFVTFGGAYAVLAYVSQAAVDSFGWLSEAQTVDGLALAETTPGPLIMVVQFVGFMAGWNLPEDQTPMTSAVVGALLTTFVTFLPCFLFIFLGAPYIESLRSNRSLDAALSGVTAAVVGVVLNLALVFGAAVLLRGADGRPDVIAALLATAAFLSLWRLKIDVLWVVLGGGLIGFLARMVAL